MASVQDIIAMKLDMIARGGRKKDFWDIHEFIEDFSFRKMVGWHRKRYPYSHYIKQLKSGFKNFEIADNDFDPLCLKNKYWELVKLDLLEFSSNG